MIDIFVPMETVSEANVSEHYMKKSSRHKMQQWTTACYLQNHRVKEKIFLPCNILLIWRGKRKRDSDNNIISLKAIRDSLANYLIPGKAKGQADGDNRLNWLYGQLPTKHETGVWIILYD